MHFSTEGSTEDAKIISIAWRPGVYGRWRRGTASPYFIVWNDLLCQYLLTFLIAESLTSPTSSLRSPPCRGTQYVFQH